MPGVILLISSISEKRASYEMTTPLPIRDKESLWQIDEGSKCRTIFFPSTINVWPAL